MVRTFPGDRANKLDEAIYIDGLGVSFNTVARLDIAAGQCTDSTGTKTIKNTGTLTVDMAVTGDGGLQTGSTEAADTWYDVLLIGDTSEVNAVKGLLVPFGTAFSESGYDVYRKIDSIRNNASSNFWQMLSTGSGNYRTKWYCEARTDVRALSAGVATTFTNVDLGAWLPDEADIAHLNAQFETGASGTASDTGRLRPDGMTENNTPFRIAPGVVSASPMVCQIEIPCPGQIVEYRVEDGTNNALTLHVQGYSYKL